MITRKTEPRYQVGQNEYRTVREAKFAALTSLLGGTSTITDTILEHAAQVVDILTTTERSLTKARKVNGGTKRRPKTSTESTESFSVAG